MRRHREAQPGIPGALFLLAMVFLLAFIIRAVPLQEYHSWDESIYLQHAERMAFGKDNYSELDFRPPMLSIIIAGAFNLWHSIYFVDVIVALLSAAIVIALFFIGRRLHSDAAGLLAALVAAVHPAFVTYGHLILTDTLVATFLAFALLFALDGRRHMLIIGGMLAGIGTLTKFTGATATLAIIIFIVAQPGTGAKQWRKRAIDAGSFSLGAALVVLPYLWWVQQEYGIIEFFFRTHEIVNAVNGGPLFYFHPEVFVAPIIAGLVLLLLEHRTYRDDTRLRADLNRFAILTIAWFVLTIGYLYRFPHREIRYALVAIVPLFVFAGVGYALYLRGLRRHAALGGIIIVIAIAIVSLTSFERLTEPTVNHWRSPEVLMSERIVALNTTLPLYVTSHYPVFGYYTNNPVIVVDGPHFIANMRELMPADGYLLVYPAAQRQPTIEWADAQPFLERIAEQDGIVLYSYDADIAS